MSEDPLEQETAGLVLVHVVDTAMATEERRNFGAAWDATIPRSSCSPRSSCWTRSAPCRTTELKRSPGSSSWWSSSLFPYGLVTAELGTAFPEEGGPYVWVREAFGRVAAAVVAVMCWVDNPIWLAGTLSITAMATFSTFFVNLSLTYEYIFGLLFVWAGIASVIMALNFGKWVANIGAISAYC